MRRFRLPPEQMGQEHLRAHVAELGACGMGASALKVQIAGLKFLCEKTLGRPNDPRASWQGRQAALGHASVATTVRYTRVSTAVVATAQSPLERLPPLRKATDKPPPARKATGSR